MTERDEAEFDSAIAIIGLGGCFPGSEDVSAFWSNICGGHVAIKEVPHDRWDPKLYWSEDRSYPDRTYSRIGGFIDSVRFDRKRFRIPPRTLESVDDIQKLALTAVADALEDERFSVNSSRVEHREALCSILEKVLLSRNIDQWLEMIDVNLNGAFRIVWALKEEMLRRGSGSMVLISSIAALRPREKQIHYSSSKAGVIASSNYFASHPINQPLLHITMTNANQIG